jgi:tetratricopeptide (TPR) repeat protein
MAMDHLQRAARAADPRVAREALETATRAANDRIWVRRNAARIYREHLDDVASARTVLDELEPLTGLEWRLAAAAWAELGDRERAIACLEKAAGNARTANDLCTIALGYHDCGFPDEGRLLIDGAETIATRALECWTVANCRRTYGGASVPILERGLVEANDPIEIITFAHALAVYDADAETLGSALDRAERKASTVDGWLALALAYQQLLSDQARALACIGRASKLAISSDHERAIGVARARAGMFPLLDDDRPRLQPHQLLRSGARTFGFTRDPGKLLGWLRSRMPRTSFDALSQPGLFHFNDDLVTLLEIQRTGALPHPLPGYFEGLGNVSRGIGPGEDRMSRAFACTLLCIDDAAGLTPGSHEGTMAMLLSTCLELGDAAVEGAIGLFAALADAYEATHFATPLVLFAELGLALAAAWLDPSDPRIDHVIDRLFRDEPRWTARHSKRWLLGIAERDGGIPGQQRIWSVLAGETLEHPRQARLRARLIP